MDNCVYGDAWQSVLRITTEQNKKKILVMDV